MSRAFIALSLEIGHTMLAAQLASAVQDQLATNNIDCKAEYYYDDTDDGTEYGAKIIAPRVSKGKLHELLVAALPVLRETFGYLRLETRG